MKIRILLRKVHYWASVISIIPLLVIILAGLFLIFKKPVDWIQPPTQTGVSRAIPSQSFAQIIKTVQAIPEMNIKSTNDISRMDVKLNKGIIKVVSNNDWEAQIDSTTGKIIQLAYRRSDFIESLHDGSYFGNQVKYIIFFPAGVLILLLWMTGTYLFVTTELAKMKKRRKNYLTHPVK